MTMEPWRFTIEFDEEKAKRNGYNVDDLYDCVGEYAEQMGNVRIGLGTWQAKSREVQFGAQCLFASPFLNSLGSCGTLSLGVPMRT